MAMKLITELTAIDAIAGDDSFVIGDLSASGYAKKASPAQVLTGIGAASASHNHDANYAPAAKGVTNGDGHDHSGGDGAQINHSSLANIGVNTHAVIDSHLSSTSNPHSVTADQVLPSQSGHGGKAIITDGSTVSWGVPSRAFTPLSLADDSYVGDTIAGTAGEALAQWDAVYLKSDGKFWKAKADSSTTCPADGVAVAAASANGAVAVLVNGFFRDDGGPTLTVGGLIYLSTATAGAITNTVPSTSGHQGQILGRALAAQIRHIKPSLILVEVP